MHQVAVIRQRPDDRVLLDEFELFLLIPLSFDQLADRSQAVRPVVRDGNEVKCQCGNLIGIAEEKWVKMRQHSFIYSGVVT
jgi:hypothetical protein